MDFYKSHTQSPGYLAIWSFKKEKKKAQTYILISTGEPIKKTHKFNKI